MSTKLAHANHNSEVCDYLTKQEDFADWVVVTAFYAALHYVDHKMFPLKHKGYDGHKIKVSSVDEYKNIMRDDRAPHTVRVDLVGRYCSEVSPSFRWLKSLAHTVRYMNYALPDNKRCIEAATTHLERVKGYCV